jgi:hypothetical protein
VGNGFRSVLLDYRFPGRALDGSWKRLAARSHRCSRVTIIVNRKQLIFGSLTYMSKRPGEREVKKGEKKNWKVKRARKRVFVSVFYALRKFLELMSTI